MMKAILFIGAGLESVISNLLHRMAKNARILRRCQVVELELETKEEMLARLCAIVTDEQEDFCRRWRAAFCYALLVEGKELSG